MKSNESLLHKITPKFGLLCLLASTPLWAGEVVESEFLRKKDFHVSADTAMTINSQGSLVPAMTRFDFTTAGDTGVEQISEGKLFTTAWKIRNSKARRCLKLVACNTQLWKLPRATFSSSPKRSTVDILTKPV